MQYIEQTEIEDQLFPSDNILEVPTLREDMQAVESFGKTIYLKESTRQLLRQYLQPGAYEEMLSHTVDLDGNRIKN